MGALEALRDTETGQMASRAAPVLGAMAGQGTREAMADRGAWVAMVDPGTQEAMAERGAREASMGGSPPKNFIGRLFISGWLSGGVVARGSGEPDGTGRGSGEPDGTGRGSGEPDGTGRGSRCTKPVFTKPLKTSSQLADLF